MADGRPAGCNALEWRISGTTAGDDRSQPSGSGAVSDRRHGHQQPSMPGGRCRPALSMQARGRDRQTIRDEELHGEPMTADELLARVAACDLPQRAVALVLAGGRGSRLKNLTDNRAKPAVYFGGKFRIIDFALSNCMNSGIRRIGVHHAVQERTA